MKLSVEGMTCAHCIGSVTRAIQNVDPHAKVDIDLARKEVRIDGTNDAAAVSRSIEAEGYIVTAVLEAAEAPPRSGGPSGCCGACHA